MSKNPTPAEKAAAPKKKAVPKKAPVLKPLTDEEVKKLQEEEMEQDRLYLAMRAEERKKELQETADMFIGIISDNLEKFKALVIPPTKQYDAGYFANAALQTLIPHATRLQGKDQDKQITELCALAWKIGQTMVNTQPK